MQQIEIEAIYEEGALKLPHELPLQKGQKVTITVHAAGVRRRRAPIEWQGSQEDLDYLILSEDNDPMESP